MVCRGSRTDLEAVQLTSYVDRLPAFIVELEEYPEACGHRARITRSSRINYEVGEPVTIITDATREAKR